MEKSGQGLLNRSQQNKISEQRGIPVDILDAAYTLTTVSGETAAFSYYSSGVFTADAGQAAGVAVECKLEKGLILNDIGSALGTLRNKSLSFTSTAFTSEVQFPSGVSEATAQMSGTERLRFITKNFTNGQFCVDYRNGALYGVKASTQTSITNVTYKVASLSTYT